MSTSLVGDECLWAAVFCLIQRGDARFFLGQCALVGVSSVQLLRGTDHDSGVVAASPVSHPVCLVFSCMLLSQLWVARW